MKLVPRSRMPGLHLTPDVLEAAYEYLRATPPFSRWKLPNGDDIKFVVTWHQRQRADCIQCFNSGKHTIRISAAFIGNTPALMAAMAHEMVHVYLDRKGVKSAHGSDFERCAEQICQRHGFDFRLF